MKFKKAVLLLTLAALLASYSSAESTGSDKSKYRLQPTDVLKITVHEHPDLETVTRVTQDGYISFPLLGKVHVEGITVQELERQLKDDLEKDYLVSAQVIVFIETYHPRQVSVIGQVKEPGKFDLPEEKDITLLEAIAMAGGFTEDAEINGTKIIRDKDGEKETIKVRVKDITEKGERDKDIKLEAGDLVIVPESFF